MQIIIYRKRTNCLYTEGTMTVNGLPFTHTVESTECILPVGIYQVRLAKLKTRRREIAIFAPQSKAPISTIAICHSWKNCLRYKPSSPVSIGEPLIPGCVVRSRAAYERLFERIEKCKTPITLIIRNSDCKPNYPISHWL